MRTVINGVRVWQLEEAGLPQSTQRIGTEQTALDLIGASFGDGVELIAIPVARLDPDFLRLGSGLAGAFIEKLQQYRLRLAIVGDIEDRLAQSRPLRDFVSETNRRGQHLFARDEAQLSQMLRPM